MTLALHGASSVYDSDIKEAIKLGIRKINVGKILKQTYFETIKNEILNTNANYNPYEIIGTGNDVDILNKARISLQKRIEQYMELFGSKGRF
jgi:fructose-bisphosphate aldolase, class II